MKSIPIQSIWLYTIPGGIAVDIKIDGCWRRAITEQLEIVESVCSHAIHPEGMLNARLSTHTAEVTT